MENYRELTEQPTEQPTESTACCISCSFCYIPEDFLLGLDQAKLYCNRLHDKPLSGCVLSEPFNYYNKEVCEKQEEKWAAWAGEHEVKVNGLCDNFRKA